MITFKQTEVAAGSPMAGSISGLVAGGPGGAIVVWLVWRLAVTDHALIGQGSRAIEDYAVVGKQHLDPALAGAAFEFRIPENGPVSYDGKLFRVVWEIVAGSEQRSGPEIAAHGTFRVLPRPAFAH